MTIEEEYKRLMEESCACRHLFDENGKPKFGKLEAHTNTVLFKSEGDTRAFFITAFTPDSDTNKIACNRLAKEFVSCFTVKQLQADYISACKKICKETQDAEKQRIKNIDFFKSHLQEFKRVLPIGDLSITDYNGGLKWEYRSENNFKYDYTLSFSFSVEIKKINDNLFRIVPTFFFGENHANYETQFEINYSDLIEYLNTTYETRLMPEVNRVVAKRVEIDEVKAKKIRLKCFLLEVGENQTVIIKQGKNSYVCFSKMWEWSKSPKSKDKCKCRRLDIDKLVEKILMKGLGEYVTVENERFVSLDELDRMTFEQIPV